MIHPHDQITISNRRRITWRTVLYYAYNVALLTIIMMALSFAVLMWGAI
jgi:hypothetical protein